jgi:hypothetical protein
MSTAFSIARIKQISLPSFTGSYPSLCDEGAHLVSGAPFLLAAGDRTISSGRQVNLRLSAGARLTASANTASLTLCHYGWRIGHDLGLWV